MRCDGPVLDPAWTVEELSLEDIVLAYMGHASTARAGPARRLEVLS